MPSDLYLKFVASSAWDNRYSVPICPGNNNPWIYGAYAFKVMKLAGLPPGEQFAILENFRSLSDLCRVKDEKGKIIRGLFNRYPDGSGGAMSHDELMGMAYLLPELAKEMVQYLAAHDGVYTSLKVDAEAPDASFRFNLYRLPWLLPFLKSSADYFVSPISQAFFAAHLLNDIRVTPYALDPGVLGRDAGGRLRIWLMLEAMERSIVSGLACWHWKNKMNTMGYSPRNQLKIEPGEHPILAECAPDSF